MKENNPFHHKNSEQPEANPSSIQVLLPGIILFIGVVVLAIVYNRNVRNSSAYDILRLESSRVAEEFQETVVREAARFLLPGSENGMAEVLGSCLMQTSQQKECIAQILGGMALMSPFAGFATGKEVDIPLTASGRPCIPGSPECSLRLISSIGNSCAKGEKSCAHENILKVSFRLEEKSELPSAPEKTRFSGNFSLVASRHSDIFSKVKQCATSSAVLNPQCHKLLSFLRSQSYELRSQTMTCEARVECSKNLHLVACGRVADNESPSGVFQGNACVCQAEGASCSAGTCYALCAAE